MRPIHTLKFWWKTRHWDRRHFPGCPIRYGTGTDCLDPELLCAKPSTLTVDPAHTDPPTSPVGQDGGVHDG